MNFSIFRSKTFWGAVVIAAAKVIQDHSPASIVEAIGIVTAAAGARQAIAKNGNGQ